MTDSHLQYTDNHMAMLNSYMTKTPSHSQAHGVPSLDPSFPTSSGLPFNVPHSHGMPHGMLPEDAMRRETRSVPPHLLGSRNQGPSGIPEGECAATAAAQLLFADRGIRGVGSGVCNQLLYFKRTSGYNLYKRTTCPKHSTAMQNRHSLFRSG